MSCNICYSNEEDLKEFNFLIKCNDCTFIQCNECVNTIVYTSGKNKCSQCRGDNTFDYVENEIFVPENIKKIRRTTPDNHHLRYLQTIEQEFQRLRAATRITNLRIEHQSIPAPLTPSALAPRVEPPVAREINVQTTGYVPDCITLINPKSGRVVKRDGKIGQQLLKTLSKNNMIEMLNKKEFIMDPDTGNFIPKNGARGALLMNRYSGVLTTQ